MRDQGLGSHPAFVSLGANGVDPHSRSMHQALFARMIFVRPSKPTQLANLRYRIQPRLRRMSAVPGPIRPESTRQYFGLHQRFGPASVSPLQKPPVTFV